MIKSISSKELFIFIHTIRSVLSWISSFEFRINTILLQKDIKITPWDGIFQFDVCAGGSDVSKYVNTEAEPKSNNFRLGVFATLWSKKIEDKSLALNMFGKNTRCVSGLSNLCYKEKTIYRADVPLSRARPLAVPLVFIFLVYFIQLFGYITCRKFSFIEFLVVQWCCTLCMRHQFLIFICYLHSYTYRY